MKRTILVSGMVSEVPFQGGAAWAVLQYLLGLRRLGHDVYFVETIDRSPAAREEAPLEQSRQTSYFRDVMELFGFEASSALLVRNTRETVGLDYAELREVSRRADLLVNISGVLTDEALLECIPQRLYLDLDPAFTQLWHFDQGIDLRLTGHTHFASVGLALGTPHCDIPTGGLKWITTLPPVVLDHWALGTHILVDALTTVANWRGYGSIERQGVHYGQKAHSLRRLIELPTRVLKRLILAMSIHPDEKPDLELLSRWHWELMDPAVVAATPAAYRGFIRGSWAELGIAKSGYVVSRSGWFSDRSACYLAAGRPVLAQDTGFGDFLPAGEGLLRFSSTDDAAAGIDSIRSDYPRHAAAARAIAETYLDSNRVLTSLIDRIDNTPHQSGRVPARSHSVPA